MLKIVQNQSGMAGKCIFNAFRDSSASHGMASQMTRRAEIHLFSKSNYGCRHIGQVDEWSEIDNFRMYFDKINSFCSSTTIFPPRSDNSASIDVGKSKIGRQTAEKLWREDSRDTAFLTNLENRSKFIKSDRKMHL